MNAFSWFILLTVATAISASDEQHGRFHLFKVKPKTHKHVELLLRSDEEYGDHPPIFILPVRAGSSVPVLMEESKAHIFEKFLRHHKIKFHKKGMTLVDKISTRRVHHLRRQKGQLSTTSGFITLYDQVDFQGNHVQVDVEPGCNWVPSSWNDKAKSVYLNASCIVLYQNYYCNGRTVQVTPLNQQMLSDLTNYQMNGILSAFASCDPDACTSEGFFGVPGNCNAFFRCVDVEGTLVRYDFTCPPGLYFNPATAACSYPDQIDPPPTNC